MSIKNPEDRGFAFSLPLLDLLDFLTTDTLYFTIFIFQSYPTARPFYINISIIYCGQHLYFYNFFFLFQIN